MDQKVYLYSFEFQRQSKDQQYHSDARFEVPAVAPPQYRSEAQRRSEFYRQANDFFGYLKSCTRDSTIGKHILETPQPDQTINLKLDEPLSERVLQRLAGVGYRCRNLVPPGEMSDRAA